jgi:Lon protease-like protein
VECGREHPVSDCSVDVVLSKMSEAIAEVIARHSSIIGNATNESDAGMEDYVLIPNVDEKVPQRSSKCGRLISLYTQAAQGSLSLDDTLSLVDEQEWTEGGRALDVTVYQDLNEGAQQQVDCQVCYNIMLDPITTFCGHTLCRKCMTRVLDHSLHCPVCRRELALPPSILRQPINKRLSTIIDNFWPTEIQARKDAALTEDLGVEGNLNVPLFVCTLGFPEQPTFLRVFEPRYRLMLRRCLEGNQQFGMLMYNRYNEPQGTLGPVHFYHIGTMLRIVNAQLLPDGTSIIETRGTYRFKVTAHGVLDGYSIGTVEPLEDVSLAEEERIEAEEVALTPAETNGDVAGQVDRMPTRDLLRLGQDFVTRMRARSANWLQQRVLDIHGQPPDDASLFPYWFASVLPIGDEEKYKLLDTRTVRERLKITVLWIRRIESQRW